MAYKFMALFSFIAIASAGIISLDQVPHPASAPSAVIKSFAPAAYSHPQSVFDRHHGDHYDPHIQYKFAYEINDEHTGDNHSHQEERNGDVVHGEYSLVDADGFKRMVQYTVNSHSGFNAVVNRIPLHEHIKAVTQVPAPFHNVASVPANKVAKQYPVPAAYNQHH